MRTAIRIVPLLLAASLALSGCLGVKAREEILTPAVQLAWTGVKEEVQRGPVLPPASFPAFDAAITDRAARTDIPFSAWPEIRNCADANIDAAPWSQGVKGSHHERVIQFDAAIVKLSERVER